MNHKHEWRILHIQWPCSTSVFCNCGEKLELDEIERRLNATECLSAEDAKILSDSFEVEFKYRLGKLDDYARTLEGKGD